MCSRSLVARHSIFQIGVETLTVIGGPSLRGGDGRRRAQQDDGLFLRHDVRISEGDHEFLKSVPMAQGRGSAIGRSIVERRTSEYAMS